jgi:hypothetical protein
LRRPSLKVLAPFAGAGAAIERSMAQEIGEQLEAGILTNAAN